MKPSQLRPSEKPYEPRETRDRSGSKGGLGEHRTFAYGQDGAQRTPVDRVAMTLKIAGRLEVYVTELMASSLIPTS